FLSVGYSACHWCHVMERECFEEPSIAALMNQLYVNIKVDREERPDIDEIYMKAVTALTGQGGWPMSVFLTPQLEPFFGATYLPPVRAYGRPSFPDVLIGLSQAYANERAKVVEQAQQLTAAIAEEGRTDTRAELPPELLDAALAQAKQRFDAQWGGFGPAPKFPHASDLRLCLRQHLRTGDLEALAIATRSLDAMANGGIHDQLGGGFHRYSVDREWRVPHFEKMLYDNAQLIVAYLEGFSATKNARYAEVARGACEWALREMQTAEGGFASAQDADSEGEEGRFFVWTPAELERVLGDQARVAAAYFDVTDAGNFEHGKSVLWTPRSATEVARALNIAPNALQRAIEAALPKLLAAREQRVHPATDDKVLTAWNGLMISALAQAFQLLGDERYLAAAVRCMAFVLGPLRQPDGRLFGTARAGRAHVNAGFDDYAFVIQALLDLYESNFDEAYMRSALELTELVESRFHDPTFGGYFTTGDGHEPLIARLKSTHDGALPSGAAVHAYNLARLAAFTGRRPLQERALATLRSLGAIALRYPQAFSHLLIAFDFLRMPPSEIVLAGERAEPSLEALLACVRTTFRPQRVVVLAHDAADRALLPLTADKSAGPNGARAYVCKDFHCELPVDSVDALQPLLMAAT
ncbi:MAG TPA: thioredoxin domain-containing protein, partial [Polyangiales bacterium]